MTKVQNISGQTLGWNGIIMKPGQIVEINDELAPTMVKANPEAYQIVKPQTANPPAARDPGPETNAGSPEPPAKHRHSYRQDGTCACGKPKE